MNFDFGSVNIEGIQSIKKETEIIKKAPEVKEEVKVEVKVEEVKETKKKDQPKEEVTKTTSAVSDTTEELKIVTNVIEANPDMTNIVVYGTVVFAAQKDATSEEILKTLVDDYGYTEFAEGQVNVSKVSGENIHVSKPFKRKG